MANRLIELYELPYLDPVSRGLLPATMLEHLTKHNIQALSPYVCVLESGITRNALNIASAACTEHDGASRSCLAIVKTDVYVLWNFYP